MIMIMRNGGGNERRGMIRMGGTGDDEQQGEGKSREESAGRN